MKNVICYVIVSLIFTNFSFSQKPENRMLTKKKISQHLSSIQKKDSSNAISKRKNKYDCKEKLGEYKSDLALVQVNGKYGFIDNNGKEVVTPKYNHIGKFGIYKSDWALVKLNGKYGFIDKKGKEVVAPKYNHIGKFNASKPNLALVKINGKHSFIDDKGNEVTCPKSINQYKTKIK